MPPRTLCTASSCTLRIRLPLPPTLGCFPSQTLPGSVASVSPEALGQLGGWSSQRSKSIQGVSMLAHCLERVPGVLRSACDQVAWPAPPPVPQGLPLGLWAGQLRQACAAREHRIGSRTQERAWASPVTERAGLLSAVAASAPPRVFSYVGPSPVCPSICLCPTTPPPARSTALGLSRAPVSAPAA